MKVGYIRLKAFATNSSSTHTPVIISGKLPEDYLIENCEFGWQPFVVATEEAKRKYAGVALHHLLIDELHIDTGLARSIVKDWAGVDIHKDGYIDHDSMPGLVLSFDGKSPHREFFNDFLNWILQPNLVMLGGNDNEESIDYESYGTPISKPFPDEVVHIRGRRDPKGFYTLFFPTNGTKTRLAFDDGIDMSSSSAPELIDVKITDYCTKGCKFCYQDSTPLGQHAEIGVLHRIERALKELEVFEVALGGGEPTSHPQFLEILSDFRRLGVIPNFTTRDLTWMQNTEFVEVVRENCGGFAFSIDSGFAHDVTRYAKELIKSGLEGKGTIQVIIKPDMLDFEITEILEKAANWEIPVTLLGWKSIGRGLNCRKKFAELDPIDWQKVLKGHSRVSVDTALVAQYRQELKEAGVANWSLTPAEGTHSMYIDAVSGKMSPSSYCDPKDYIECGQSFSAEIIKGAFSQFTFFASEKAVAKE
jgi:hypothetical protein